MKVLRLGRSMVVALSMASCSSSTADGGGGRSDATADSTPVSCSAAAPSGACPNGQTCVGTPPSCRQICTVNSDCGFDPVDGTKCCQVVPNGASVEIFGVCGPTVAGACRCLTKADCTGGEVCTPSVVTLSVGAVPSGTYTCAKNDGATYDGCGGCPACSSAAAGSNDCYQDAKGNQFCGRSCSKDDDCLNPGVACCKPAACKNCALGCSKPGVCVPC